MATTKVPNNLIDLSGDSGAVAWASGTSLERPSSPNAGDFRYNTDDTAFEFYNGSDWRKIVPIAFIDFLLVAGGGAYNYGAGGAGGLRTSYGTTSGGGAAAESAFAGAGETFTITIGGGGIYSTTFTYPAGMGVNSSITSSSVNHFAAGGGRGGGNLNIYTPGTNMTGYPGGSGGGGGYGPSTNPGRTGQPGTGTANEGYPGAQSRFEPYPTRGVTGSGGGAGGPGQGGYSPTGYQTLAGGLGLAVNILNTTNATTYSVGDVSGSDVFFASGGAARWYVGDYNTGLPNPLIGPQTPGGGGPSAGGSGLANTGGGGANGGNGGSGVCILRVTTESYTGLITGSPDVVTEGDDTILIYTGSGTYTA